VAGLTIAGKVALSVFAGVGAVTAGAVTGVIPLNDWVDRLRTPQLSEAPLTSPQPPANPLGPDHSSQTPPAQTETIDPDTRNDARASTQENQTLSRNEPVPVTVPSFDILRVEPDGSVLIAGAAEPSARVEIWSGSTQLGETIAASNGDFVFVFDERLDTGDYEIVLRADSPDGRTATSTETAIVSIPEQGTEGVLALVEKPGEPSRLISTGDGAANPMVPVAPDAPDATVAQQQPRMQTEPVADADTIVAGVKPDPETPSAQDAARDSAETQAATRELETRDVATAETDNTQTEAPQAEPQTLTANAPEQSDDPVIRAEAVRIEAVEIDGETVFVAGAATPGSVLRVYANEILLGTVTASEGGRFLVRINRDLPVGDYVIRADVLDQATSKVIARAAVPFRRDPGERLAAIAPEIAQPLPTDGLRITSPSPEENSAEQIEAPPTLPAPTPQGLNEGQTVATASTDNASMEETSSLTIPQTLGDLSGQPSELTQQALKSVDSSVIIRGGDTLWQISRRVYGRGVKYTTIYRANSNQISDPDRIWPGQIFAVPDESIDDRLAEDRHRELIIEQR